MDKYFELTLKKGSLEAPTLDALKESFVNHCVEINFVPTIVSITAHDNWEREELLLSCVSRFEDEAAEDFKFRGSKYNN